MASFIEILPCVCELCQKNFCIKCERKGISSHKHVCYGCDGLGSYR